MDIRTAKADELEQTLRLAFRHLVPEELDVRVGLILAQFAEGNVSLDGVFRAEEDGVLVGALFSQRRPDGNLMLWVPAVTAGRPADPFFEPFEAYGRRLGMPVAVALADFGQEYDRKALLSAGRFEFLSDLVQLVATVESERADEASDGGLAFVPLSEVAESAGRLEFVVEATYRNTRDFPRLMGVMPVDKVLQGYRNGAVYRPDLWFFVREGDRDVGVLLLTDSDGELLELTYMGLIEEARGRGLAKAIVRFARQTAFERNRPMLLTTVDERNAAALKTYLASGFRAWNRKKVFARFF